MLNNNTGFQNNLIYKSMSLQQQKMHDRQVFEQFMSKPVIERVTADRPRGRLIKENMFQQFGSMFTDTAKDVRNLGNALVSGKSNDHELGRMNDLGMKLGGALVAGALMGSRQTTNKKLMELIGFGTFFSVMSLWPKVAIDLPTKLIHGFNPHQKFEDSQGRKKLFFQDNQYLPWDVWSKEEINKVADRMNVPKDLKDREEYTKEKMRTIALQDNTLWMLTAGFATPLLTSLACNRIEEGMRGPIAQAQLKKMGEQLQPSSTAMKELFDRTIGNPELFKENDELFASLTKQLKNGQMPEDFAERLGAIFDLTGICGNREIQGAIRRNNVDCAQEIISRLFPATQGVSDDLIRTITGADDAAFQEAKGFFDQALTRAQAKNIAPTFANVIESAETILDEELSKSNPAEWTNKAWVQNLYEDIVVPFKTDSSSLSPDLRRLTSRACTTQQMKDGARELETIYAKSVKPAQAGFRIFGDKLSGLGNISGECYNKTTREFVKLLGFTDKEIKTLRNTGTSFDGIFEEMVSRKIQEIGQDKNKLNEVLSQIDKVEKQFSQHQAKNGSTSSIKSIFSGLVDNLNRTMAAAATGAGERSVLNGTKLQEQLAQGITEHEQLSSRASITSVESVITKLKAALKLEEAIQNDSLYESWQKYITSNNMGTESLERLTKWEKARFYSQCREIVWQSNYADAVNKFYLDGNGDFFKAISDVLFNGDLSDDAVNAWKAQANQIAHQADSIPFPQLKIGAKTKLEDVISDITAQYCKQNGVKAEDITDANIIKQIKEKAEQYIANQGSASALTHKTRFAQFGESALRTCEKQVKGMYNDKTWMKVFGGATIALIGITLISQLFFGKVKDAHLYKKKDPGTNNNNDTFTSGRK